jgi:DNA-directed RNA polymerase
MSRLLDSIFRGWDREDPSAQMKLELRIGGDIYAQLVPQGIKTPFPWSEEDRLQAGAWLLRQAIALDLFDNDEDGFPCVSDKWKPDVKRVREELIHAHPVHMPLFEPPPDWTGWRAEYPNRHGAQFVRDWRPETKAAIEEAFKDPNWEHARGVNALQRVPFRIDAKMLDLVERFAVDVMGHDGAKRDADEMTVAADAGDARYIGDRRFYIPRNCDKRGRINSVCHFNFDRGDHVRSLFRFARGMNLDREEGTFWLEVHCANCNGEGGIDKRPWRERINWVVRNRHFIERIADDPDGTFEQWKDVDSPFCFVAACRELVTAWKDPENFETHFPIGFDGSCNGLQHLALMARDPKTAYLVNVGPNPADGKWPNEPQDVYASVIATTIRLLEADDEHWARWWLRHFNELGDKKTRKLIKTPAMTYAYSATQGGMRDQILEVYRNLPGVTDYPCDKTRLEGKWDGCSYLAGKIIEACRELLPGPTEAMECIRQLAEHRMDRGLFLEWTSPSSFPVSNRYQKSRTKTVNIMRSGVRLMRHNIADGVWHKIMKRKTLNSTPANFVHSMDASHAVKVINTAGGLLGAFIRDFITTHDCYYCLAPVATQFNRIIRYEMDNMYQHFDALAYLRSRNVDHDIFPRRPYGALVSMVQFSEPAFG